MSNPFLNSTPANPKPTFSDSAPDPIQADAPRTYNPFLDGPVGQDQGLEGTPTTVVAETPDESSAPAGTAAETEAAPDAPDTAPRARKSAAKPKAKAVAPADSGPLPPSLADALAKSMVGQHPLDIAEALDTVFARTRAGVRPVDMLRLCKAIRGVSDGWYNKVRDALLEYGNEPGDYYGYRISEVAPSRKVDYERLKNEFPEAYAAVVSKGDKPGYRFVLGDEEDTE